MRLGIATPLQGARFELVREVWLEADAAGFHSAFVGDHLLPLTGVFWGEPTDPVLEGWTALSSLAPQTRRLRVGTMTLANTFRHPGLLAKMAVTLDHATAGRLVVGLGAGYFQPEHDAFGLELPPVVERLARLDEACAVLQALWAGDTVSFAGDHYRLDGAICRPRPVQERLPLLVGGAGERRLLRLVARHADVWDLPSGREGRTPEDFARLHAVLRGHCQAIGRDPGQIATTLALIALVDERAERASRRAAELAARLGLTPAVAPRQILAGDPDGLAGQLAAFAAVGLDELVVVLLDGVNYGDLGLLAREVLPRFG